MFSAVYSRGLRIMNGSLFLDDLSSTWDFFLKTPGAIASLSTLQSMQGEVQWFQGNRPTV